MSYSMVCEYVVWLCWLDEMLVVINYLVEKFVSEIMYQCIIDELLNVVYNNYCIVLCKYD